MKEDQFQRGIEEFNKGFYFECHDTLEELWMETVGNDRLFLQGLIQVSVGFYHFGNSNYKGAVSQFMKGLQKLQRYRPGHRGIELEDFMERVGWWLERAEEGLRGGKVLTDHAAMPKLRINVSHSI